MVRFDWSDAPVCHSTYSFAAARIGFEQDTYRGSEPDEVINVAVAVLGGTLSQEVVVRIYTMDSIARCKGFHWSLVSV